MRSSFFRYTLSDAMMPLLDISMLLLGFFIILFATASEPIPTPTEGLELAGQVIVVTIQSDNKLSIQTSSPDPISNLDMADFASTLQSLAQSKNNNMAIIRHEDVFATDRETYEKSRKILGEKGFLYADIYR